jgi:hypothetical protein
MNKAIRLILFSAIMLSACKKDVEKPGSVPVITFEAISPGTVHQFKDSVMIAIGYTDGDGDLGENSSTAQNAFVTDSRNNLTYYFRIRQLAPDHANITIRGKLDIIVPAVALQNGSSGSEPVSFSVKIKDRAGNMSNSISTSTISVVP